MADDKKKKEATANHLNIELPEAVAQGVYSNLAIITHNPSEFVVDFVQIMPNVPKAKVQSRVILTPYHAKRLLRAISENVKKYENQFGPIPEPEANVPGMPPINFNLPTGEA